MDHLVGAERRYDIDWMRVIAIGLLLIYHITIGFQPWGVLIGFIQNGESLDSLWIPMSMLNVWRIPLLFYISGMGLCFASLKRDWMQLLLERSRRILLPFVFGILVIVPVHVYLWQQYYQQDLEYIPNAGHLWFLGNIFSYVLIMLPVILYLKRSPRQKLKHFLNKLWGSAWGLLLIIVLFVLEAVLVNPGIYEMYAMTWHGYFLGLLAFVLGYVVVYAGYGFWQSVLKNRWWTFALALIMYGIRYLLFELQPPLYLLAIESCLWIFTVMGFGHRYLNHSSKALSYLSKAAYPVYIVHMAFLYLASWISFEWSCEAWCKLVFVFTVTTIGCLLTYEYVIRRIKYLRPLFGLNL